jgi:hypothetical protein
MYARCRKAKREPFIRRHVCLFCTVEPSQSHSSNVSKLLQVLLFTKAQEAGVV